MSLDSIRRVAEAVYAAHADDDTFSIALALVHAGQLVIRSDDAAARAALARALIKAAHELDTDATLNEHWQ